MRTEDGRLHGLTSQKKKSALQMHHSTASQYLQIVSSVHLRIIYIYTHVEAGISLWAVSLLERALKAFAE
jgi:hypothetical protein